MTTQETERIDVAPARTASTASASKAYERRIRRQRALEGGRLTRTGTPIAAALSRVPFVAMIILLLAGGIVGVLWLNTMSDAAGLRASQSRLAQQTLSTSIQAASREIATLKDPGVLAAQARSLGLVPPGDAAMLEVGKDGKGTVIGTPTPVPAAAPPAVATLPTTAAPASTAAPKPKAPSTAIAKAPATKAASPAGAKPATPSGAAKTTPKANAATVKTTAAKTPPAKTTAAKTTAAKTTPAKTTPAKSTTASRSQQAPVTTGAGQ